MLKKKNGFFYALLASILVHLFMFEGAKKLPTPPLPVANKVSQIEIDIREHEDVQFKEQQQIVREAFTPDQLKTRDSMDPLAFFSAQNQRVKKQLKALISGMTSNRTANAPKEIDSEKKEKKVARPDLFKLATKTSPILVPEKQEASEVATRSSTLQLPQGVSTLGEHLPDEIEFGEFTALNTDRYLYYSFFARVEELIRYGWEDGVRATTYRTPKGIFQSGLNSNWVTHVEIMLKPTGEFHKALLMKESGISGFDWAAIDSFAAAKLFPNPPKEMIEQDGFIHLRYTFTVRVNPKALAKQN